MKNTATGQQMDAWKELVSVGTGHAVTALSRLLNQRVDIDVPLAGLFSLRDLVETLGGEEAMCTAVCVGIESETPGFAMLIFPEQAAVGFSNALTGRDLGDLDRLGASALEEAGNICVGACLTAMHEMTGLKMLLSAPVLATDLVGALLDGLCMEFAVEPDQTLVVETKFHMRRQPVDGHLLLTFAPDGFQRIVERFEKEGMLPRSKG